ncbi:MAG: hypothetical protein NTW22_05860 [Proteobacteria bacterium]|nr:hypothetical protein [Pseudomonadota bacterium]
MKNKKRKLKAIKLFALIFVSFAAAHAASRDVEAGGDTELSSNSLGTTISGYQQIAEKLNNILHNNSFTHTQFDVPLRAAYADIDAITQDFLDQTIPIATQGFSERHIIQAATALSSLISLPQDHAEAVAWVFNGLFLGEGGEGEHFLTVLNKLKAVPQHNLTPDLADLVRGLATHRGRYYSHNLIEESIVYVMPEYRQKFIETVNFIDCSLSIGLGEYSPLRASIIAAVSSLDPSIWMQDHFIAKFIEGFELTNTNYTQNRISFS